MRTLSVLLAGIGLAGCVAETEPTNDESVGVWREELSIDGRWMLPSTTVDIGDTMDVPYTGAGPWVGPESCSGGMLPGTRKMREYLLTYLPQTHDIGGYSCRPIVGAPSSMSVHATGRALDIMIPTTSDGTADNDLGDPIGRWLIEHSEELGIQLVIWDRTIWTAEHSLPKARAYTGEHPHHDHLHVELSTTAAAEELPWYAEPWVAPSIPDCAAIAAEGGVIDDENACFMMFGPTRSWRLVDGVGDAGGYRWTNAFEDPEPSNWARWSLDVAVAGRYHVEVHVPPGEGAYAETRYGVHHAGEDAEVTIDQSTASGWTSLGAFDFAAGRDQRVEIYDNAFGPIVAGAEKIAVDSIRLTPGEGPEVADPTETGSGGESPGLGMGGGCAAAPGTGRGGVWGLLALCGLALFRRRARRA